MHLPDTILGSATVKKIQERIAQPVLTIGTDHFTRAHLARLSCFNFLAAATLSNIVTHHLKVQNTKDLFQRIPPSALALPGLGTISLATLGAAFESKLGKTLSDYINHHLADDGKVVTFSTIKSQFGGDSKAEKKAKKDENTRKRARGRKAHELRVERFMSEAQPPPPPQSPKGA